MDQPPEPPADVPEFLVEWLGEQSPETLRLVVEYLQGEAGSEEVPEKVVEAATIQDEETLDSIAAYGGELASFLETAGHGSLQDVEADGEEEDDDDSDGTMALRYGSL